LAFIHIPILKDKNGKIKSCLTALGTNDIIRYISKYLIMLFSQTFAALADPNRQSILQTLRAGEQPVAAIAENLNITLATLSHHLDILKRAGLISARRSGRQIFYSLNMSVMEEISESLIKFIGKKKINNK